MKALVVAAARPNFVKIAPILSELASRGHRGLLVHTGQHYDDGMSDAFFRDLELPEPDFHLGVGSGTHAWQTARVMETFEPVLLATKPDWVIVVGDVNSTLACALVTTKLKEETGTCLAHVEAGLRSGDWRMAEEVNRVLTDRMSDLLLTPSRDAQPNLLAEGIAPDRIIFVGNVMIDTLFHQLPQARGLRFSRSLGLPCNEYAVVTLHRPATVDNAGVLETTLEALGEIARQLPVVFPMHPRTRSRISAFGLVDTISKLHVLNPVSYTEMLSLIDGAAVVITDSGGLQEETTALGVPCVTLREQTERPITIQEGTNRLAGWPLTVEGVTKALHDALSRRRRPANIRCPEGWDGKASKRIVDALISHRLGAANPFDAGATADTSQGCGRGW
jgi:UDP-N-acetylglucosamine 2-epimerase (non-hydrolysing)